MHRCLVALSLAVAAAAQAPAAPSPVRDLAGTILSPAPAADAKPTPTPTRVTCWRLDMQRATIDPVCDGAATADGRFAFRAVPWLQGHDWGFNTMVFVARRGQDAVGLREVHGDQAATEALQIQLLAAATLRGVVHDANGKPVAGAAVWPWMFGKPCSVWLTTAMVPWRVQSAADGSFSIPGLPAGVEMTLMIRHPAFAEARAEKVTTAERCEVELEPGAAIAGKVRYADGKPAARVPVSAQALQGLGWARTWTDADGRYELRSLPEASYNVWAEAEGFTVVALAALPAKANDTVAADDLVLVRGGFVVGRVIDTTTGKPVLPGAMADVAMYGPARPQNGGGGCECAAVQSDGTFKLRAPAGTAYVYLRPGEGWVEADKGQNVEVKDGAETTIEFRVARVEKR